MCSGEGSQKGIRILMPRECPARQVQSGDPAFAALDEQIGLSPRQRIRLVAQVGVGLCIGESQVARAQLGELTTHPHRGRAPQRRRGPGGQQQAHRRRQFIGEEVEQREDVLTVQVVHVLEDKHRTLRHLVEGFAQSAQKSFGDIARRIANLTVHERF